MTRLSRDIKLGTSVTDGTNENHWRVGLLFTMVSHDVSWWYPDTKCTWPSMSPLSQGSVFWPGLTDRYGRISQDYRVTISQCLRTNHSHGGGHPIFLIRPGRGNLEDGMKYTFFSLLDKLEHIFVWNWAQLYFGFLPSNCPLRKWSWTNLFSEFCSRI